MDGPLIDVGTLAVKLAEEEPPVLLDCRWQLAGPPGIDSYNEGHIPGAVFIDLDTELAGPPGEGGRHPVPAAGDFQAVMRRAGVRPGRLVVVYDDADATIAARAWWELRYFGHEQVRVLDGGMRAWVAAGRPVTSASDSGISAAGAGRAAAGDEPLFTARPGQLPVLDDAAAGALARSGVLLDARAGARYRGETEPVDVVAGHIPGAVSAPTTQNVTAQGLLKTPAELREVFAAVGIKPPEVDLPGPAAPGEAPAGIAPAGTVPAGIVPAGIAPAVGAYCGSGVTAAHTVLALHLAGIPAALYVGSWSGWITDPARPIATGPQAG